MASKEDDWIFSSTEENLSRYQKDGNDLSQSINSGQRISDLRGLADISVSELSSSAGITNQELLALEAGIMSLQPELALRLAKELGVAYSDLYLSDEGEA